MTLLRELIEIPEQIHKGDYEGLLRRRSESTPWPDRGVADPKGLG